MAYQREGDAYVVAPRAIATLTDPRRMEGTLGTVRHGGRLVGDVDAAAYNGGRAIAVRYAVEDDVAIPLDQDGLLLFSFYGNLQDVRDAVDAHGIDVGPIFPLPMAWNPAVSWLLELAPVDNAAYATGSHIFVLLPDGDDRDVPVVANVGVVAHEFGHALLHLLMTGDPQAAPIVNEVGTVPAMWQASLHEGFADSLAVLLLDDPDFLAPTLDLPARRVTGDAALTAAITPESVEVDPLLGLYDPYPLGTVFASMVWDVRVVTDDPSATLDWLLRGVQAWAPASAAEMDGAHFLSAFVRQAADDTLRSEACVAIAIRFGDDQVPVECR